MRGTWARAGGLLLLVPFLLGVSSDGLLTEPSLLMGAVAALLCAWGATRHGVVVASAGAGSGPVAAARDHHRALGSRAVPRQRDPDAAGHTRSRAPSGLLPAV